MIDRKREHFVSQNKGFFFYAWSYPVALHFGNTNVYLELDLSHQVYCPSSENLHEGTKLLKDNRFQFSFKMFGFCVFETLYVLGI
jgi:hypothetical protein